MHPPPTKSPDPEEVAALARNVIRGARFPQLATVDGDQPRVRPVSPVRVDGFTVYVANLRRYHKTGEIAANPKVELNYLDDAHDLIQLLNAVNSLRTEGKILAYNDRSDGGLLAAGRAIA